jgi:hypothetical protein
MNEELWVECSPKDQWELYRIHKWNTLNGDKTFSLAPPKDFMSNQQ